MLLFLQVFPKASDFLDCLTFAITNRGITVLAHLVPHPSTHCYTFSFLAHRLYEPIVQVSGFLTSKTVGRKRKHMWINLKNFKIWKTLRNYIPEREKCKFFGYISFCSHLSPCYLSKRERSRISKWGHTLLISFWGREAQNKQILLACAHAT